MKLGIDVALSSPQVVLGNRKVGLVSNAAAGTMTRLMNAGIFLTTLFAPEHGFQANQAAGSPIPNSQTSDALPIYSLYGTTMKPTMEMLAGVDVLLFDLQTVGLRFYTYLTTLLSVLEAAAEQNIPLIVCDRPNPLGGNIVAGPVLEPAYESFVGCGAIPIRHGLTIGELARLFNEVWGVGADLTVIPCTGWRRNMWFEETGLRWQAPSPNLPDAATVLVYAGICFLEGTNLSEGRGTPKPFKQIGAPWLDGVTLAARLNDQASVICHPTQFTPTSSKFRGELCCGIEIEVTDRHQFRPITFALLLLAIVLQHHPAQFTWNNAHFDRLLGTDKVREELNAGIPISQISQSWQPKLDKYMAQRERVLLY